MNHSKRLQRFLSGVVAVTFFVTSAFTPVPMARAMPAGRQAANVESPAFIPSFSIPAEFGRVTDEIKSAEGRPVLVHIQEAHANYDAQKNIQNILGLLTRDYGIREVFLEGAGHQLKPELFRFFPDEPDLQEAVQDKLMQTGELTGAEAFLMDQAAEGEKQKKGSLAPSAILHPTPLSRSVVAWGVEEASNYAQNRETFRRVFKEHKNVDRFSAVVSQEWHKAATVSSNKPLRDLLKHEIAFEGKQLPLADWLDLLKAEAGRALKLDLTQTQEQKDWPALVRFFRLKTLGSKIDQAQATKEKKVFLADLESRSIPAELLQKVARFLEHKNGEDLPSYQTRFTFEKLVDLLPENYSFEAYPHIRLVIQQGILLSEVQGEMLQAEMKTLIGKVIAHFVKTRQDKRLVEALHQQRLLEKLLRLELGREEYEEILFRKITPSTLMKELALAQGQGSAALDVPAGLERLYQMALNFYRGAIERENGMMKKTLGLMKDHKQTQAVLITGGFHSEGMKEKAIQNGLSYVEITPRIGEVSEDSNKNYLEALLGPRTVENSQIAALRAASDGRFLREVNPLNWRRELAGVGARVSVSLLGIPSITSEKAHQAVSDFLHKAIAEISITPGAVPSFARSEVRQSNDVKKLRASLKRIVDQKAAGFKLLSPRDAELFASFARLFRDLLEKSANPLLWANAERLLIYYKKRVDLLRESVRRSAKAFELIGSLEKIVDGTAAGFSLLKPADILSFKLAAKVAIDFLLGGASAASIGEAERVLETYRGYVKELRRHNRSEVRLGSEIAKLKDPLEKVAQGKDEGLSWMSFVDARDFRRMAEEHLETFKHLRDPLSSEQIVAAKGFLEFYRTSAVRSRSLREREGKSEMPKGWGDIATLIKHLKKIVDGKADGFGLLKAADAQSHQEAARAALLDVWPHTTAGVLATAEHVLRTYIKHVEIRHQMSRSETKNAPATKVELFNFSEADLKGSEALKPSQFLREKGIDFETLRGSKVFLLSRKNGIEYAITLSLAKNFLIPSMIDTMAEQTRVSRIEDIVSIRAERTVSRSEMRKTSESVQSLEMNPVSGDHIAIGLGRSFDVSMKLRTAPGIAKESIRATVHIVYQDRDGERAFDQRIPPENISEARDANGQIIPDVWIGKATIKPEHTGHYRFKVNVKTTDLPEQEDPSFWATGDDATFNVHRIPSWFDTAKIHPYILWIPDLKSMGLPMTWEGIEALIRKQKETKGKNLFELSPFFAMDHDAFFAPRSRVATSPLLIDWSTVTEDRGETAVAKHRSFLHLEATHPRKKAFHRYASDLGIRRYASYVAGKIWDLRQQPVSGAVYSKRDFANKEDLRDFVLYEQFIGFEKIYHLLKSAHEIGARVLYNVPYWESDDGAASHDEEARRFYLQENDKVSSPKFSNGQVLGGLAAWDETAIAQEVDRGGEDPRMAPFKFWAEQFYNVFQEDPAIRFSGSRIDAIHMAGINPTVDSPAERISQDTRFWEAIAYYFSDKDLLAVAEQLGGDEFSQLQLTRLGFLQYDFILDLWGREWITLGAFLGDPKNGLAAISRGHSVSVVSTHDSARSPRTYAPLFLSFAAKSGDLQGAVRSAAEVLNHAMEDSVQQAIFEPILKLFGPAFFVILHLGPQVEPFLLSLDARGTLSPVKTETLDEKGVAVGATWNKATAGNLDFSKWIKIAAEIREENPAIGHSKMTLLPNNDPEHAATFAKTYQNNHLLVMANFSTRSQEIQCPVPFGVFGIPPATRLAFTELVTEKPMTLERARFTYAMEPGQVAVFRLDKADNGDAGAWFEKHVGEWLGLNGAENAVVREYLNREAKINFNALVARIMEIKWSGEKIDEGSLNRSEVRGPSKAESRYLVDWDWKKSGTEDIVVREGHGLTIRNPVPFFVKIKERSSGVSRIIPSLRLPGDDRHRVVLLGFKMGESYTVNFQWPEKFENDGWEGHDYRVRVGITGVHYSKIHFSIKPIWNEDPLNIELAVSGKRHNATSNFHETKIVLTVKGQAPVSLSIPMPDHLTAEEAADQIARAIQVHAADKKTETLVAIIEKGVQYHPSWAMPLLRAVWSGQRQWVAEQTLVDGKVDWTKAREIHELFLDSLRDFVRYKNGVPELWAAAREFFLEQWGRDTFISMIGILLDTKRFEEAKEVMRSFSKLQKNGLIPNRIPDSAHPEWTQYNTSDGTLLFIRAVKRYLELNPGDEAFAREMILVVKNGLESYRDGTGYDAHKHVSDDRATNVNRIYMDPARKLIVNPEQSTWMDAWRDNYGAVTPRGPGMSDEINALWISGIDFYCNLLDRYVTPNSEEAKLWQQLSQEAQLNYSKVFWNDRLKHPGQPDERENTLFDAVDPNGNPDGVQQGAAIRPNAAIAMAVAPKLLTPEQLIQTFDSLTRELFTPQGPRTLSPRDREHYHPAYDTGSQPGSSSPDYKLHKDFAYHQGTVWPWLMGDYLRMLRHVRELQGVDEATIKNEMKVRLEYLLTIYLYDGMLSEVYDGSAVRPGNIRWKGNNPHQAWSLSETFAILEENNLLDGSGTGFSFEYNGPLQISKQDAKVSATRNLRFENVQERDAFLKYNQAYLRWGLKGHEDWNSAPATATADGETGVTLRAFLDAASISREGLEGLFLVVNKQTIPASELEHFLKNQADYAGARWLGPNSSLMENVSSEIRQSEEPSQVIVRTLSGVSGAGAQIVDALMHSQTQPVVRHSVKWDWDRKERPDHMLLPGQDLVVENIRPFKVLVRNKFSREERSFVAIKTGERYQATISELQPGQYDLAFWWDDNNAGNYDRFEGRPYQVEVIPEAKDIGTLKDPFYVALVQGHKDGAAKGLGQFISAQFDDAGRLLRAAIFASGAGMNFEGQEWGRDTMMALVGIAAMAREGESFWVWDEKIHEKRWVPAADVLKGIVRRWVSVDDRGRKRIDGFRQDGHIMYNVIGWAGDYVNGVNFNTVDAPLWFLEAVMGYVLATGDKDFLNETLRDGQTLSDVLWETVDRLRLAGSSYADGKNKPDPAIKISGYLSDRGMPEKSIQMDAGTGFIFCPHHKFTWMDTEFTWREGYPVEIQALWARALKQWAEVVKLLDPNDVRILSLEKMAAKVDGNIEKYFWNQKRKYPFDILGTDFEGRGFMTPQQSIQNGMADPVATSNPVIAAWAGVLDPQKAKQTLQLAEKELHIPGALRSRGPHEKNYYPDRGAAWLATGDGNAGYHSGQGWVWPIPVHMVAMAEQGIISPEEALVRLRLELASVQKRNSAHSLPELIDSNPGANGDHQQGGPAAQTWSVALAAYAFKTLHESLRSEVRQGEKVPLATALAVSGISGVSAAAVDPYVKAGQVYGARSELRTATPNAEELSWAQVNTPHVAKEHIYSRQWECGLPMDLLEKIAALYSSFEAGEISQATLTGGLGALMPDLFEGWAAIGMNVTGIHPLWNFIKNAPGKGYDQEGRRKLLADIIKQFLEKTDIEFEATLSVKGNPKTVFFRVYKTHTPVHKSPQYYIDAYTKLPDGKEEPFFQEVYDDHGKREEDMAFFAEASERLIQILENDSNPNITLIDHEVFASLPSRQLKRAKRVTLNHTVFRPGLFEAWEGHYDLLEFPAQLHSTIVHDGKIGIADFTAEVFHLISGVNLVEHLPALLKNIFRTAWHRVKGYYDREKQIRSTNGVFLPRWQSPARRALIERYKEELQIPSPAHQLPVEADDRLFFSELDKEQYRDLREKFKDQDQWVVASDVAELLIWLREKRDFAGAYDWLGNTFKAYQEKHSMDQGQLVAHLREMQGLLLKAVNENLSEDWAALQSRFGEAYELLLADPIAANVRRFVPYKGPDKYEEILKGIVAKAAGQAAEGVRASTLSEGSMVADEAIARAGLKVEFSGKFLRPHESLFSFWKAYKDGKDLNQERYQKEFEGLRDRLKGQPAVEALRNTLSRLLVGGRTFDVGEAHDRLRYIRFMTELLGLEDRIATLEDHTYYEAQIIFRGAQAGVMLSDEDLEASATSMMKVKCNGGEVAGPYAGSNPEIWTILKDQKTGEIVEVLNEKGEPNTAVITQDILREKLRTGEWELLDGVFVAYSDGEKSTQEGGGRRPSARSLLEALQTIKTLRSNPALRRQRSYQAVSTSWKVDSLSQVMAQAHMIENMLQEHKEREAMFEQLKFEDSDYAMPMAASDFGWKTQHPFERHSAKGVGLFGMFRSFRNLKTWQRKTQGKPDGDPATRGMEALDSLKYHAYHGDIFKYLRKNVLDRLSPGLQPFKDKIETLEAQAQGADDRELVALNLEAMDLAEKLLVRMAGDWFERYMQAGPEKAELLRREITQGVREDYQPWAEYIARYLEGHPNARVLRTRENKIRSFIFTGAGSKRAVMVNLNVGAPVHRERDEYFDGFKARTQVPIDEKTFRQLTGNVSNAKYIQLREPKLKLSFRVRPKEELTSEVGIGIPMPSGIEVIQWVVMKWHHLLPGVKEKVEQQEPLAITPAMELIHEMGLTQSLLGIAGQDPSAMNSLKQLIRETRTGYKPPEGMDPADHFYEQLEVLADLDRDMAVKIFGENLKPLMSLISLFRPDLLKTSKASEWDATFAEKIGRAISVMQAAFEEESAKGKQHNYYVLNSSHQGALVLARKDVKGNAFFITIQFAANDLDAASDGKISTRISSESLTRLIDEGAYYQVLDLLTNEYYNERNDLLQGWVIRTPYVGDGDRVQMLYLEKNTNENRSETRAKEDSPKAQRSEVRGGNEDDDPAVAEVEVFSKARWKEAVYVVGPETWLKRDDFESTARALAALIRIAAAKGIPLLFHASSIDIDDDAMLTLLGFFRLHERKIPAESVAFRLNDLHALAHETGLDRALVRGTVLTQREYDTLQSVKASDLVLPDPPREEKRFARDTLALRKTLREIGKIGERFLSHWAVQELKAHEDALKAWDMEFKDRHARRSARRKELFSDSKNFQRWAALDSSEARTERMPPILADQLKIVHESGYFDTTPYERIKQLETSLDLEIRAALASSAKLPPVVLRASVEKILKDLMRWRALVESRAVSYRGLQEDPTRPEAFLFFIKKILAEQTVQDILRAMAHSEDKPLAKFAKQVLEEESRVRIVREVGVYRSEELFQAHRALLRMKELIESRKSFYGLHGNGSEGNIMRLYSDMLKRIDQLFVTESPKGETPQSPVKRVAQKWLSHIEGKEFARKTLDFMNLFQKVWESDEKGWWVTGLKADARKVYMPASLREGYRDLAKEILQLFRVGDGQEMDGAFYRAFYILPLQRSEVREAPGIAAGEKRPEQSQTVQPSKKDLLLNQSGIRGQQRGEMRQMTSIDATLQDGFFQKNQELGGGTRKGFERVTTELTDGVWSLVAHTVHAVDLVASIFDRTAARDAQGLDGSVLAEPKTLAEKARLATARRALGIPVTISAGDAFIIRPGLAFKDGALFVKKMVFGDAPVVIYDPKGEATAQELKSLQQINARLTQAQLPLIQIVKDLGQAKELLKTEVEKGARQRSAGAVSSLHLKVMANVLDPLALLLKQQYKDNAVLMTSQRFKAFLELAGVATLVSRMQNEYLATSRSA